MSPKIINLSSSEEERLGLYMYDNHLLHCCIGHTTMTHISIFSEEQPKICMRWYYVMDLSLWPLSVCRQFPIVNFQFICSNIPAAPAYGVYLSQMIRYSRACGSYQDFLDRGLLLTRKLSEPRNIYGRHRELVDRYGISVSQMTTDMFHLS